MSDLIIHCEVNTQNEDKTNTDFVSKLGDQNKKRKMKGPSEIKDMESHVENDEEFNKLFESLFSSILNKSNEEQTNKLPVDNSNNNSSSDSDSDLPEDASNESEKEEDYNDSNSRYNSNNSRYNWKVFRKLVKSHLNLTQALNYLVRNS